MVVSMTDPIVSTMKMVTTIIPINHHYDDDSCGDSGGGDDDTYAANLQTYKWVKKTEGNILRLLKRVTFSIISDCLFLEMK